MTDCFLFALLACLIFGCSRSEPIALDLAVAFPAAETTELPGMDIIPEILPELETGGEAGMSGVPQFGIVYDAGTEEDFTEMISRADVVAVDFTADWCGPCQRLLPEIERMAGEYPNVCFITADIGKCRSIAAQAGGVQSVPCVRVYGGGKVVGEVVGNYPARLEGLIRSVLKERGE